MPINDWLSNNSDALLGAGFGLLSGKNAQEQVAGGIGSFAQTRQAQKQQNKTLEFLRQMNPELAQAVEAGALSPLDAYKTHVQAQAPMKPLEVNGRLVDPKTYQVLADFSDKKEGPAPSFQKLDDGTYGYADPTQRSFTPLGQAQKPNDASNDYATREAAAASYGLTPGSPQYQSFVLTGKIAREDAQPLTATDKKALWSAEDEIPVIDNTLASLEQARKLNRETFTGVTAGARGWLGTSVPGGDYLVDGKTAKATSEFNKLMSMEAIQSMAQTLKGATTDQELNRFVEILADPSTDPDIRERTIDRMMALAQRQKEIKANRINELRGGGIQAPSGQGSNTGRTKSGLTFTVEQ